MSSFAAAPPFSVVQNDATLSAVAGQGAAGAVFWSAGSVTLLGTKIASDTPAAVWLTVDGATTTVSVADPAQGTGTMHVTVTGDFKTGAGGDPAVTVTIASKAATVAVDRAGGVTHTATLSTSAQLPDAAAPDAADPDAGRVPDAGASKGTDAGRRASPDGGVREAGAHDAGGSTEASSGTGHGCSCRVTKEPSGWTGGLCVMGLVGGFLARRRRTTPETSKANE